MNPCVTAALEYAQQGYSVVLVGGNKRPVGPWERAQHERATPETIREWYYDQPGANVGIVTGSISGLVVVDTDNEQAEAYAAARLPPTRTSRTGKGRHRIYQHPGREIRNRTKMHGIAGLDVRGDGGYIVAPPSLHPSGVRYQWENDLPIAPFPDSFFKGDNKRDDRYRAAAIAGKLADCCRRVAAAPDGSKHDTLRDNAVIVGGYLHYGTMSYQEAEQQLYAALPASVEDHRNALQTIRDGLDYGQRNPLTIDVPAPSSGPPPPPPPPPPDDPPGDERLLTVGGKGKKTTYQLPPGVTWERKSLWMGEKLLYMGKLWVAETGTNVHTEEQTALVRWGGNSRGEAVVLRADLGSQAGITKSIGGAGGAVHAGNARNLSRYLVEFLQTNRPAIPHVQHSEYYGPVGDGLLLPAGNIGTAQDLRYIGRPISTGKDTHIYTSTLQAIAEWAPSVLWAVLCFSVSSPIYALLGHDRNPIIHLGGASGSGKTTITHFAAGTFGDPRVIPLQVQCGSGTTTPKGMSTALIQANGLPVFFDDVHKMLERKKQETEGIIYDFANGQNRTWGTPGNRVSAGGQEIHGLLITAGETPLNFMNAGSNNRVFSVDCNAQPPLGCPARSQEGTRRARLLNAAWQAGAGTLALQILERIMHDWRRYQAEVAAFETDPALQDLQAWRRLLAVAAATMQEIAEYAILNLNADEMMRSWARTIKQNNITRDPAEEAFERVRLLFIQSQRTADAGGWENLMYERKLIAARRQGQNYWRVLHIAPEWKEIVGTNAVEMFGHMWAERGWLLKHKDGSISKPTWVGGGAPRCILVSDQIISPHEEPEE